MCGDVDLHAKPITPKLYLARPNREIIAKLSEAYQIQRQISLSELYSLSFTIPFKLEENHELVRNRNASLLKERYQIKVEIGSNTEWYIITKVRDAMSDRGDTKFVECVYLSQELNDKLIGGYTAESKNARQVLEDVLGLTASWSIGYMDPDFELSYRSWEFSNNTLLDAVYQIMTRYNAIAEWDSVNRQLNMIKPELHGVNRLGTLSHHRYMKSIDKESNAEIVVTRLRPVGKDGMGIQRHNVNGSPYLEDFSYWLYPFQRDDQGHTLVHSQFMSEALCHALLDYQALQHEHEGQFKQYVEQLDQLSTTLSEQKTDVEALRNELAAITQLQLAQQYDEVMFFHRSTYNGGGESFAFDINDALYYAVLVKMDDPSGKTLTINGLPSPLSEEQWVMAGKLSTGTNRIQMSLSGAGATSVFIQIANISDEEFHSMNNSEAIINRYNYEHKEMEIASGELLIQQTEAQIEAINTNIAAIHELLSVSNNFTPEQLRELDQFIFEQKFEDDTLIDEMDLLEEAKKRLKEYQVPQLALKVDIVNFLECLEEQAVWDKLHLGDRVTIHYDVFQLKVEAKIVAIGFDYESSSIELTIASFKDLTTAYRQLENYIYQSNKTSGIVNDGKSKWNQAIVDTSEISKLFERFWDKVTNQIHMAVNQTVTINDKGITITDHHDPDRFLRLTNGAIGLTRSGGLRFETAISADGVIAEMVLGKLILGQRVTIGDEDGIWLTEGPRTTITDRCGRVAMQLGLYDESPDLYGLVIHRYDHTTNCSTDLINKIVANSEEGFKIQQWNGAQFVDKFYADSNGLLYAEDMTTKRLKIMSHTNELLLDSFTKFMDIGKFEAIITDGKLTSIEKLQIMGERSRIQAEYAKLLQQANTYKTTTRDTSIRIDITPFTAAYEQLLAYLEPLLADMETTSIIDRNEFVAKFDQYYDETVGMVNAINNSIKYSSVQFGAYFNNVIIDYVNGIVATRDDHAFRSTMSATKGFSIEKNMGSEQNPDWKNVFWADTDGIVRAKGIEIKDSFVLDSKIVLGTHPNMITLDPYGGGFYAGSQNGQAAPAHIAMDGTASFRKLLVTDGNDGVMLDSAQRILDLNKWNVLGAGRIEGDSIVVNTVISGMGIISNLAVNKLITFGKSDTIGTVLDYFHVQDNKLFLKTGEITGRQQMEVNENLLYWTDASKTTATTEVTAHPVWDLTIDDRVKFLLDHKGSGPEAYPRTAWGQGDGVVQDSTVDDDIRNNKSSRGFIEKPRGSFDFLYYSSNYAKERSMRLRNEGIVLIAEDSDTVINTKNIQFNMSAAGSLVIQHASGTTLEITSNGKIVLQSDSGIEFNAPSYVFQ
ncbi:phage tail protein [Paenibacillus sp. J5C_2022]|uniref:phage tail protein n=1 Tax=Paenibacillus sp. J5C2022 TaxID=2977129 RepID=UPI0021D2E234|nr:phage tail protein [Paenibacillus sp. J5C2022]MCU6710077.1 phage tail protein [Paenibacillus sp. J5C2022]